jgi:transcriptional antiterminator NusG
MMEDPVDQTEAQESGDVSGQTEAPEAETSAEQAGVAPEVPAASSAVDIDSAASVISSTKKWYVVHAYSGFEKNVARTLLERVELSNLKEFFGEILVPTEEVVEMRGGQKRRSERKFFPGYVLVQMELNDDTWHLVKETPRVMGFIGGKADQPAPLTDAEANAILDRVAAGSEKATPKTVFEPGEIVRVIDGPFNDFSGVVEEVNYEKSRLHVAVTILGRSTPVELDFDQVEKG